MFYVLTDKLSFEIAREDLPKEMEWLKAVEESRKVGERWRLPNFEELSYMHKLHTKAIGNFKNDSYVSSEGVTNYNFKSINFLNGSNSNNNFSTKKPPVKRWVRLIRNI